MRDSLSTEDRLFWSQAVARHVLASEAYAKAGTVMAYASFGSEVRTGPLLHAVLSDGKKLLLPRCYARGRMNALLVYSLETLVPGRYGILEPAEGSPVIPPEEIDLVLVPGLLFDRKGYRLGYGGGYYDRFLPGVCGLSVGLSYACQVTWDLRPQPHDVPVHAIATEAGLSSC